jgi:predicted phosphate transport protein (TIGR00153 family)
MFNKLIPKSTKFFDLFAELSEKVNNSAKLLHTLFVDSDSFPELKSQIHLIENSADDLTHKIINELNETFVTPFDREDIHLLTNSLDDIVDVVDSIATRLSIYKLKQPLNFGPQLSEILVSQTEIINKIVKSLDKPQHAMEELVIIRNLETEGDNVFKDALEFLFDNEKDVVELIKKKEILENIERAVDKCQTVTIVIEAIMIKNI